MRVTYLILFEGKFTVIRNSKLSHQVHDIVADPVGKFDIILSRHTLQVVNSKFHGNIIWQILNINDNHSDANDYHTTALEDWRHRESDCQFCAKRIKISFDYKLPNNKGKMRTVLSRELNCLPVYMWSEF